MCGKTKLHNVAVVRAALQALAPSLEHLKLNFAQALASLMNADALMLSHDQSLPPEHAGQTDAASRYVRNSQYADKVGMWSLSKKLPKLKSLVVKGTWSCFFLIDRDFEALPRGLEKLEIGGQLYLSSEAQWQRLDLLPPTLTYFHVASPVLSEKRHKQSVWTEANLLSLPKSLTDISNIVLEDHGLLRFLPSTVLRVQVIVGSSGIGPAYPANAGPFAIRLTGLERSQIQSLEVRSFRSSGFLSFEILPSTITELILPNTPPIGPEQVATLPPMLTNLQCYFDAKALEPRLLGPPSTTASSSTPKSPNAIGQSPKQLQGTISLPGHLTSLTCFGLLQETALSSRFLKLLPPTLTSLATQLHGEVGEEQLLALPQTLTSIELRGSKPGLTLTNGSLATLLPRGLKKLHFGGAISENASQFVRGLPPTLTSVAFSLENYIEPNTSEVNDCHLYELPPTVTELHVDVIPRPIEGPPNPISALPKNLLAFTISRPLSAGGPYDAMSTYQLLADDSDFETLPQSLTHLNLGGTAVDAKIFRLLPRSLRVFQGAAVDYLSARHVATLPSRLLVLGLDTRSIAAKTSVKAECEAIVASLPKGLVQFDIAGTHPYYSLLRQIWMGVWSKYHSELEESSSK